MSLSLSLALAVDLPLDAPFVFFPLVLGSLFLPLLSLFLPLLVPLESARSTNFIFGRERLDLLLPLSLLEVSEGELSSLLTFADLSGNVSGGERVLLSFSSFLDLFFLLRLCVLS